MKIGDGKSFKLIAIRPLKGCNKKFTKVLKDNNIYQFYKNYDFTEYNSGNRRLKVQKSYTPDLYSIQKSRRQIKINVSAIVGENGSGKSSLVELFYVICYNISAIHNVLYDEDENKFLTSGDIVPEIKAEVFYQINGVIRLLNLSGAETTIYELKENEFVKSNEHEFDLNNFFYTISVNYSLHSLNSSILGDWINKIFHKNDGYQTPIVINPFRSNGVIDINNEEYLVKSRLITNILSKSIGRVSPENTLRNVLEKKIAYRLKVKLNRRKFSYDDSGNPNFPLSANIGSLILPYVFKYFLNDENFNVKETKLNKYALEYILYKLISISSKYEPYKSMYKDFQTNEKVTDKFISALSKDKSHVTFKLTQAINFLTNSLYHNRKETFDLTVSYLTRQLNEQSKEAGKDLIEILPPAFFDVDIEFKDADMFSLLSSGEKQRIYSIATIIYHINNINSANNSIVNNKYRNVNIIFDELELYFHPELQRNLINDIIESIKKIDLYDIDALNILLITHSPFVLSDIPTSNILFLNEHGISRAMDNNLQTYGGNIHELLAQSFFLNNGFIGEFAKQRIQRIINNLDMANDHNDMKRESIWAEIQIIGEPFLKSKLEEMYYIKYSKSQRIKELKEELRRLEND